MSMLKESLLLTVLYVLVLLETGALMDFNWSEICLPPRDRGHQCNNGSKPGIMYFFDNETEHCLPFRYNGCGGNENRYPNRDSCERNCIPFGYNYCALGRKSMGICINGSWDSCPKDSVCSYVGFYPRCCPKETEDLMDKNENPRCTKGQLVMDPETDLRRPILGKSCDDEFCPENSKCHQQEIFAYCCQ